LNHNSRIPLPTVERLATYFRYLIELEDQEVDIISSAYIEEVTGINAAQFRKDLSYFGEFGTPGVGYNVRDLRTRIAGILKVKDEQPVLLVGAGSLGSALVGYTGLRSHKFNVVAAFDNSSAKIGRQLHDLKIMDARDIKEVNETVGARVAIVAVPAAAAQNVVDRLVDAGVKVILNFAPATIRVPDDVVVRHVCFIRELTVLSFYLPREDASEAPSAESLRGSLARTRPAVSR